MEEPPKPPKFGLLKFPFPLREQVIRNMEFMDVFHFSTLSKRSKNMVRSAKYQTYRINFDFDDDDSSMDHVEVDFNEGREDFKISLSDSEDPSKRNPYRLDGLELANLIDEPSDDYRKKMSSHILFIHHSKWTSVRFGRNFEHVNDLYLWDVTKQFDSVILSGDDKLHITPKYLQSILNSTKAKKYTLDFKIEDINFEYQEPLDCEQLIVVGTIQWLDTDNFLKRNPNLKLLQGKHLPGEKINDLLKQWINGEAVDLKELVLLKGRGYPADVIFDGILTMETKLT
ncbi:hypothetical protein B9Z55_015544 [Caenorhabditis nigoni]|nr:hypothetical protein B9Z55_015544 [Caenorhabditis nigoni]